jgi:transcriptional regulator with XRE-family HTH domain
MGFKDNLKAELAYSGMLVKELASKSGVNKFSIDNYLNKRGQVPSVEAATKIAQALGFRLNIWLPVRSKNGRIPH